MAAVAARRTHVDGVRDIAQRDLDLELAHARVEMIEAMGPRPVPELASRNMAVELRQAQERLRMQDQRHAVAHAELQETSRQLELLRAHRAGIVTDFHNAEAAPLAAHHEARRRQLMLEQTQTQYAQAVSDEKSAEMGQKEALYMLDYLKRFRENMIRHAGTLSDQRLVENVYAFRPWQKMQNDRRDLADQSIAEVEAQIEATNYRYVELGRSQVFQRERQAVLAKRAAEIQPTVEEADETAFALARWFARQREEAMEKQAKVDREIAGAEMGLRFAQQRLAREQAATQEHRSLEAEKQELLAQQQSALTKMGCW